MIDIEKSSKFLRDIKDDADIEKIIKQKTNLSNLLNLILKQINNDIDINSINNLKDSQIWAFIYNNSSKTINDFKSQLKFSNEIINELSDFTEAINNKKEKKNLGKKTKREKEKEIKEGDKIEEEEIDEEGEEEEDMEEDNNNKKEDINFGKQKDIFFSMKDLNNFADQFEEEDNNLDDNDADNNNKIKSAPNKLILSSSRKKNKLLNEENNNEEMEEDEDDENNSLYSEEQEIKAEIDSDEEIKFDKFFDKPEKRNNNTKEDNESDSDVDENEIFNQIKKIEEKMISNKKDWSTKGEVLGKERPKDSLLTKAMDFEVGLKAPPIPDREFTDKLENMIKQRIIDDLFDDPIKKDIINLNEQKKAENELDFEKSKKGLGEIYEEKYLGNENTESKVDEIKKECDDLCNQLFDIFKQMTNGTATPYGLKGKKEEIGNITNIPAIQIEDIGNFVSDNTDKIKSGKEMINIKKIRNKNKEEMTSEELRNFHNRKKRNIKSRIHKKENKKKMEELTKTLGSKFEAKIKMKQEKNKKMEKMDKTQGKEYKSGKFFDKINEMATKEDEKKKKNNKITE